MICSYPVPDGGSGSFLVTNKHVVEGSHSGSITFSVADASGQPLSDRSYKLHCSEKAWEWTGHLDEGVDVAAISITLAVDNIRGQVYNIYYRTISRDIVLTEEQTRDMDAIEEVWMVGYPNGIYDQVNNLPVVRRGITATPYAVDYEAKPQFLIVNGGGMLGHWGGVKLYHLVCSCPPKKSELSGQHKCPCQLLREMPCRRGGAADGRQEGLDATYSS